MLPFPLSPSTPTTSFFPKQPSPHLSSHPHATPFLPPFSSSLTRHLRHSINLPFYSDSQPTPKIPCYHLLLCHNIAALSPYTHLLRSPTSLNCRSTIPPSPFATPTSFASFSPSPLFRRSFAPFNSHRCSPPIRQNTALLFHNHSIQPPSTPPTNEPTAISVHPPPPSSLYSSATPPPSPFHSPPAPAINSRRPTTALTSSFHPHPSSSFHHHPITQPTPRPRTTAPPSLPIAAHLISFTTATNPQPLRPPSPFFSTHHRHLRPPLLFSNPHQ